MFTYFTYLCSVSYTGEMSRGVRAADDGEDNTDNTDAWKPDAEYYDNDASGLLKRLQHTVDSPVDKRRFCRHNYVYNPVSGRCQASLLVSSSCTCSFSPSV